MGTIGWKEDEFGPEVSNAGKRRLFLQILRNDILFDHRSCYIEMVSSKEKWLTQGCIDFLIT